MLERAKKVIIIVLVICGMMTSCAAAPLATQSENIGLVSQNTKIPSTRTSVTVAKDGTGDFTSIQSAVNAVPDMGTIIVKPGIYTECVKVEGKGVNIVGSGVDECILMYDTVNYFRIPLEIAAGSVSGLTVYGTHTRESLSDDEVDYIVSTFGKDRYDAMKNVPGYAVHIEQDTLYGRTLEFNNCKFISENNQCVGIGSRGKSKLTFRNCQFINNNYSACIFMHDSVVKAVGGESTFTLENCSLVSSCDYAIALYTYNDYNKFNLLFRDVTIASRSGVVMNSPIMVENFAGTNGGWCGLCNTKLLPGSDNNSVAIMNY